MLKKVIVTGLLLGTLTYGSSAEGAYTEALRAQYAGQDVYAEYTIEHIDNVDKKHTYTDVDRYSYARRENDMYFRHIREEDANRKADEEKQKRHSFSLFGGGLAGAFSSALSTMGQSYMAGSPYDLEMIRDGKHYSVDTEKCTGMCYELWDFAESGKPFILTVGSGFVDNSGIRVSLKDLDVMRDVVTSSPDRMSVEVVQSSVETIDEQIYDCEKIIVQRLSTYGKPLGYKKTCRLYFQNGELKCFSLLKIVRDKPIGEKFMGIKTKQRKDTRVAKVTQLTKTVDPFYFDLIDRCELTSIGVADQKADKEEQEVSSAEEETTVAEQEG